MLENIKKSNSTPSHSNSQLVNCYYNFDTGLYYHKLQIHLNGRNIEKEFLSSKVLNYDDDLMNAGVRVYDGKLFYSYICKQETELPLEYKHQYLGWDCFDNTKIFKAYNAINFESCYSGIYDIKPKGSLSEWISVVNDYAMQSIPLQFMLVLGLSAVLTGYLKDFLDGSIVCHIYSDSSTGKSTSTMLALSTAGNPELTSKNSLMLDWSDTPNSKIASIANNFGVPFALDEASKLSENDISSFLYSLANGKEKSRLKSNGERKDTSTWCSVIISNGEQSLLSSHCNQNNGLRARILEIFFDSLTESAEQADKLREGILSNYGWANTKLAQYLLDNESLVVDEFNYWQQKLKNTFHKLNLKNRILVRLLKRLSVIMATAVIAEKAVKLKFDIEGIENILIKSIIKQNEDIPIELKERLVEYMIEDIASNRNNYLLIIKNKSNDCAEYNFSAIIKEINNKTTGNDEQCTAEIQYFPTEFAKLLKKSGFSDLNLCVNELKKMNYLVTESGHNTVKRRINGANIRVYVVRFPIEKFNIYNNFFSQESE